MQACSQQTRKKKAVRLVTNNQRFAVGIDTREGVAQLVEQRTFNPLVLGSSPSALTLYFFRLLVFGFYGLRSSVFGRLGFQVVCNARGTASLDGMQIRRFDAGLFVNLVRSGSPF